MSRRVSVTIITPCYNGGRFIAQTLQSALAQTKPLLEILVVDDGSTDDSAAIAESFGAPVRVIRQANQGESVARNQGLMQAQGSHVLFLDADDLLEQTSVERLAQALEAAPENAVAIMGCAWFSDDPNTPYTVKVPSAETFFPAIIESNLAPPHCWLAPTALVRGVGGFFADLRWFEDWDLWWRVGLEATVLVRVPHVGALYRRHPGSQLATTTPADQARGHAVLMARMAQAFLARPETLAAHGDKLFWSAFTALTRARAHDVSWTELEPLEQSLRQVSRGGSSSVSKSRLARMIRLLGVRPAARLHAFKEGRRR